MYTGRLLLAAKARDTLYCVTEKNNPILISFAVYNRKTYCFCTHFFAKNDKILILFKKCRDMLQRVSVTKQQRAKASFAAAIAVLCATVTPRFGYISPIMYIFNILVS